METHALGRWSQEEWSLRTGLGYIHSKTIPQNKDLGEEMSK